MIWTGPIKAPSWQNVGRSLALFAFDHAEALSEHTSPFEALVLVLEGTRTLRLTIGGNSLLAQPGSLVRMPANVRHVVEAVDAARMLLALLRA